MHALPQDWGQRRTRRQQPLALEQLCTAANFVFSQKAHTANTDTTKLDAMCLVGVCRLFVTLFYGCHQNTVTDMIGWTGGAVGATATNGPDIQHLPVKLPVHAGTANRITILNPKLELT
jgi:hypothetical protein